MSHGDSYWAATANADRVRPPLASELQVDVAVIGAGFTGLSAAYHLQQAGVSTAVLEQQRVGWGASGRNGGHLLPGFKHGFRQLAEAWGLDAARQMLEMARAALDLVERLVHEHGIECSYARCGNLWAAHKPRHVERFKRDQEFLAERLGYETWVLERGEMHRELGTDRYHGVHVDPHGASFHPLNFTLGLADVVERLGGRLYDRTPVTGIAKRGGGFVLTTPEGRVRAAHVIVATNAYTSRLTPRLWASVAPSRSNIIVTEPVDPGLLDRLIPNRRVTSDTKRLLYYFRPTPDGRVLFGGRGSLREDANAPLYERLRAGLLSVFPELKDYRIAFRWGGLVAMTRDRFPHIGTTEEGLHFALGYCGRGAAMAVLMGRLLALNVRGEARRRYPVEELALPRIPFPALRGVAVRVAGACYALADRFL